MSVSPVKSVSPARAAAFDILLRVEKESAYASELLHSQRYAEMSLADHALTTELVMGVLRWRSLLDARIASVSSQPLAKLDLEVLTALRLGAYQLGWLDRIPAHAAIHESVELVKRARKRSAVPFANAILRKLPLPADGNGLVADLISEASTPADLAAQSAHPGWIVERWVKQFDIATTRRICDYDQRVPTTTIRLRDGEAEEDLRKEGVRVHAGEFLASARRVVSGDVTRTRVFAANRIVIQDEASQLVAALVGRGARILDACAAPGGKTWSIADRNSDAAIVALELHPHRAALLRKRVAAPNVKVITGDLLELQVDEPFDRVLVDAPCTGTGTLARNPEIKWRLGRQDVRELALRQIALLRAAMKAVSPRGRLIYSTCSLEREENEGVVEQALAENPAFRLFDCAGELRRLQEEGEWVSPESEALVRDCFLRTIPGVHQCDGFFAAILERH
jgi:16S rRNA (cytosine967-C5)-methyltransferase